MHKVDKEATKKVFRLKIDGEVYKVPEPSIHALVLAEKEKEGLDAEYKELIENEEFSKAFILRYEFMLRQIEVLAPEIPEEVVKSLTVSQYEQILIGLGVLIPVETSDEDSEEGEKKGTKKNKGSRT